MPSSEQAARMLSAYHHVAIYCHIVAYCQVVRTVMFMCWLDHVWFIVKDVAVATEKYIICISYIPEYMSTHIKVMFP